MFACALKRLTAARLLSYVGALVGVVLRRFWWYGCPLASGLKAQKGFLVQRAMRTTSLASQGAETAGRSSGRDAQCGCEG